ncbi:MAG: DUF5103 domain-containing protein [Ignavibacteriaceae bacterium]|nr:DUF5103 domain-containing protein [Ignavibacteriaceae bacterium]
MKKNILLSLLFIILIGSSYSQVKIKSLRYYPYGDETSLPVIMQGADNSTPLVIDFDIDSKFVPDLDIIFRFCDKNWKPVDNLFLANYGQNISYNIDFTSLPASVLNAHYHYNGLFPDQKGSVSFPFSGKYMFFITDALDTSVVYASGQFYAVSPEAELDVNLKKESLEDKNYYPLELGRIFNITSKFNLPDKLFPAFVNRLEIIENKKIFYPYQVDRSFNTNTRQFYWDGNKAFSFLIRDIKPGNEYRQTDLRDINKFGKGNVNAQFDGIEYPRFDKFGYHDMNGGDQLTDFNNEYADYLNVNFSFRPADNFYGKVFLTGSFNNWQILPGYEMSGSGGLYNKTIELKRGVFDYQFVTADIINGEIKNEDWIQLEGNFWETENVYNIFVYYEDPAYGGYEKIIAYQKITSK